MFFNKKDELNLRLLPLNLDYWNQNLRILGVPYGNTEWELFYWRGICDNIENDLKSM